MKFKGKERERLVRLHTSNPNITIKFCDREFEKGDICTVAEFCIKIQRNTVMPAASTALNLSAIKFGTSTKWSLFLDPTLYHESEHRISLL